MMLSLRGGCHVLFPPSRRVSSMCRPDVRLNSNTDLDCESYCTSEQLEGQLCSTVLQNDYESAMERFVSVVSNSTSDCLVTHNLKAGPSIQQCDGIDESTSLQISSRAPHNFPDDDILSKADAKHAEGKLDRVTFIEPASCQFDVDEMFSAFPEDEHMQTINHLCEYSKSLSKDEACMSVCSPYCHSAFAFVCIHIPICRACTDQYIARKNIHTCAKPIGGQRPISSFVSKKRSKQLHSKRSLSSSYDMLNGDFTKVIVNNPSLNDNFTLESERSKLSISEPSSVDLGFSGFVVLEHRPVLQLSGLTNYEVEKCVEEPSSVAFASCANNEVVLNSGALSVDDSDFDNRFSTKSSFCDPSYDDNDVWQHDEIVVPDHNHTLLTLNSTVVKSPHFSSDVFLAGESEYLYSSDDNICSSQASSSSGLHSRIQSPYCSSPLNLRRKINLKTTSVVRSPYTHSRSLRQSPRTAAIKSKARSSVMDDAGWCYFNKALSAFALEQSNAPLELTAAYGEGVVVESDLLAFAGALELLPISSSSCASCIGSSTPVCQNSSCKSLCLPCSCSPSMSCDTTMALVQHANSCSSLEPIINHNSLLLESTLSSNNDHLTSVKGYIADLPVVSLPVIVPDAVNGCLCEYSSTGEHSTCSSIILPTTRSLQELAQQVCLGGMDYEDESFKVNFPGDCFNLGGEENFEPDYEFLDEDKVNDALREIPNAAAERRPVCLLPDEVSNLTVCVGDVRTVSLRSSNVSKLNESDEQTDCCDAIHSNKKIKLVKPGMVSRACIQLQRKRPWRQSGDSKLSDLLNANSSPDICHSSTSAYVVSSHMEGLATMYEPGTIEGQCALMSEKLADEVTNAEPHASEDEAPVEEKLSVGENDEMGHPGEDFLEGDWSPTDDCGDTFWEEDHNKITEDLPAAGLVDSTDSQKLDQRLSSASAHASASATMKRSHKETSSHELNSIDPMKQSTSGSKARKPKRPKIMSSASQPNLANVNKSGFSTVADTAVRKGVLKSMFPRGVVNKSKFISKEANKPGQSVAQLDSECHNAVKPIMSSAACLIKSWNYQEVGKLSRLMLLQQDSSQDRWDIEAINCFVNKFVSDELPMFKKYQGFVRRLLQTSFSQEEQKYCILFLGVHLMHYCVDQKDWKTAFNILEDMVKNQVYIHKMVSNSVQDTESVKMAVQVCCKLNRFDTLGLLLDTLKYFKDPRPNTARKQAQMLSVVLAALLQELAENSNKFQLCRIGFKLTEVILKSCDQDPEIHAAIQEGVIDLKSVSLFMLVCVNIQNFDLLLQFCGLQSQKPTLMEWMPQSLTKVITFLGGGSQNQHFWEAVRLAKLAADLGVYPSLESIERLVLSDSMSKEEMCAYLCAFLKEVGLSLHNAGKSLAVPFTFSVLLNPLTNKDVSKSVIEESARRFEAALAAIELDDRQWRFRRIGNRYCVEIADLSCSLAQVLPSVFSQSFFLSHKLNLKQVSSNVGFSSATSSEIQHSQSSIHATGKQPSNVKPLLSSVGSVSSEIQHTQSSIHATGKHQSNVKPLLSSVGSVSSEIQHTQSSIHATGKHQSNVKPLLSSVGSVSSEIQHTQSSIHATGMQQSNVKPLLSSVGSVPSEIQHSQSSIHATGKHQSNVKPLLSSVGSVPSEIQHSQSSIHATGKHQSNVKPLQLQDNPQSSLRELSRPTQNNMTAPQQVLKSVASSTVQAQRKTPLLPTPPSEKPPTLSSKRVIASEFTNERQNIQQKGALLSLPPDVSPAVSLAGMRPNALQSGAAQYKPNLTRQIVPSQSHVSRMQKPPEASIRMPALRSPQIASQAFGINPTDWDSTIANQWNMETRAEQLNTRNLRPKLLTESSDQYSVSSHNSEVPQKKLLSATNQWDMELVKDRLTGQTQYPKQLTNSAHTIENKSKLLAPPVLPPVNCSGVIPGFQSVKSPIQRMPVPRAQQPASKVSTPVQHQAQQQSEYHSQSQQPGSKVQQQSHVSMQPQPTALQLPHPNLNIFQQQQPRSQAMQLHELSKSQQQPIRPRALPIAPASQRFSTPSLHGPLRAHLQQQRPEALQQQTIFQGSRQHQWVDNDVVEQLQSQDIYSSHHQTDYLTQQHPELMTQQSKQQIVVTPSNVQKVPFRPQLQEAGVKPIQQHEFLSSRELQEPIPVTERQSWPVRGYGTQSLQIEQPVSQSYTSHHVEVSAWQRKDLGVSMPPWSTEQEASYPIVPSHAPSESQSKTSSDNYPQPFRKQEAVSKPSFVQTQSRGLAPRQLRPHANSPQTFEPKVPKYISTGTLSVGIRSITSPLLSSAPTSAPLAGTRISQVSLSAIPSDLPSGYDTDMGQGQQRFQPEFQVAKRDIASSFFHQPAKFSNPLDAAKSVATVSSQRPNVSANYEAQPPMTQYARGQYNYSLPTNSEHSVNPLPCNSTRKPLPDSDLVRATSASYNKDPVFIAPAARHSTGSEGSMQVHRAAPLPQPMPSTQATTIHNAIYQAITDRVLRRVDDQVLIGVISMSDVAKSEFVSIIAGNFYAQLRRRSENVQLSNETFTDLDEYADNQIEVRRLHSEFIKPDQSRRW